MRTLGWREEQRIREARARLARNGRLAAMQGVLLTSPNIRRLAKAYAERLEAERE